MASLLRRNCSLAPARRAFSTSTPRLASLQWFRNDPEALADTVPEYPHGPALLYKQSNQGLYGGQRIRFGNNVSVKGKNKSRRSWRPNILNRRLFSKALNRHVQVRVSARVLRTIDKLGGLDEYLLGEKETRIRELGESGWWLRWAIMQTPRIKSRFAAERKALGLPATPEELSIEEEDAEAVLEASTPDAEIAELTLSEEADPNAEPEPLVSPVIAEDDAFQIEQSKDLPPLRFRVGPNKHIELTEQGWRTAKPLVNKELAIHRISMNMHDVKAELNKRLDDDMIARRIFKLTRASGVPARAVKQMRPVQPEQRDAAGNLVMEEHIEYKPIRKFKDVKETQMFKNALVSIRTNVQGDINSAYKRLVQEKYDQPVRSQMIARENAKVARRERKAREIAVPVEEAPVL